MYNKLVKTLISYTLISSIFITGQGFPIFGFSLYWYYPLYILFIIYSVCVYGKINRKVLVVLIGIILYSILTYNEGLNLVFKQIVNLTFSTIVFYNFIVHEDFDLTEILQKYITFSKIVLLLGFVQVTLFVFNLGDFFLSWFPFLKTTNISFRFQSITSEPSYIAITFIPPVFLSLHNVFYKTKYFISKTWSFLFIGAFMLTISSVAFIGLVIMILLLYFKNFSLQKLLLMGFAFLGIFIFSYISYRFIPMIRLRVDDTAYGLTHDFYKANTYKEINLSTYALLSNLYVTKYELSQDPLTGNGLGTHELLYKRFVPIEAQEYFSLNKEDANSMALRLLSETGLIGFSLFCFFLLRYKMTAKKSFSPNEEILWMLNTSIVVMMAIALLRNGNYTIHGRILFILLYYYTHRQALRLKQTKEIDA